MIQKRNLCPPIMNDSTRLHQLLEKLDPEMRVEVMGLVKAFGFSEQDPLFSLLLATSTLQVLVLKRLSSPMNIVMDRCSHS
jgi:hypothetical protein